MQIDLLKCLQTILKNGISISEEDKTEFDNLSDYMDKLSDKDLSDWISKTGLQLLDQFVQNKKEKKNNNNYYFAALIWIEKRYEFAGKLYNDFENIHKIIEDKNEENNKLITSIESNIENIDLIPQDLYFLGSQWKH